MAAGEYEARKITIFVDSTYVRDGISKWITNWKKRNWKTADGEPVKNADLWVPLDSAVSRARTMGFDIRFEWIKGHSGNPGNERADQIATIETEKARKPEIAA